MRSNEGTVFPDEGETRFDLRLGNEQFTDEWTIIAARESRKKAVEIARSAQEIGEIHGWKPTPKKEILSPGQEASLEVGSRGSNLVNIMRPEEIAYYDNAQKAA